MLSRWLRVYSKVMWLFRILKVLFRLWLRTGGYQGRLIRLVGSHLFERILKNSHSNAENYSDISEQSPRDNGRQANRVTADSIPSAKSGIRIGLFILGVLVALTLLVLVPILWAVN